MVDKISADIHIDELVNLLPEAVNYLMENGIKCIACGEPIWGTLAEVSAKKKFDAAQIQKFVADLNHIYNQKINNT